MCIIGVQRAASVVFIIKHPLNHLFFMTFYLESSPLSIVFFVYILGHNTRITGCHMKKY